MLGSTGAVRRRSRRRSAGRPAGRSSSSTSRTSIRPSKWYPLVAAVLAGGVGELAGECLVEAGETFEVVAREPDREAIRRDRAADTERAAGVHLAAEPAADLDRLQTTAAKRLREGAFDQPLKPVARTAAIPSWRCYRRDLEESGRRPAGFGSGAGTMIRSHRREWRNWQTRRIQVPVPERVWGFKSPLAHPSSRPERRGVDRIRLRIAPRSVTPCCSVVPGR